MNGPTSEFPTGRLLKMLRESAQRSSDLHSQFLQVRRDALLDMRTLIGMQITGAQGVQPQPVQAHQPVVRRAIFNSHQLDEFGTGKISRCFGPAFAHYDGKRIPRIPNGDLKMMSRVVSIQGCPHDFEGPSSIVVEYDVPENAWYFQANAYPDIPCSLYMEIALQPCGFLSAYLDTYAMVPYGEFFFRNLDGNARVLAQVDLRGKTISTQAKLLSSVVSSGTVIQKFSFVLSCEGQPFYQGESLFGYFSAESMANQTGLDSGRPVLPLFRADPALAQSARRLQTCPLQIASAARPHYRLASGQLSFLDEVSVVRDGGQSGKGYIYASTLINPQDWFYPCHFYQDPVMPGSLGVEAILEAMQAYALAYDLGSGLRSPHFGLLPGSPAMAWRYRGQITQQHKLMELEVHLRSIDRNPGQVTLTGDASLWADGLRIYELKNAAVGILQG